MFGISIAPLKISDKVQRKVLLKTAPEEAISAYINAKLSV
jgi:hypothetical protein